MFRAVRGGVAHVKSLRSILGLLMISALLGLMFHQHDCGDHHDCAPNTDSQEQCPAAAWHAGAVQPATLPVAVPAAPQFVVAVVQPSVAPVSLARPHSFLPRGPPSVPFI
jgi:hypothetical protein